MSAAPELPELPEPQVLEPQCEWTAAEVADEERWTEHLSSAEQDEVDAALRHALTISDDVLDLGREHFPLPTLATRIAGMEGELIDGRGFVRIRGVDRSAYTQAEMEIIYWGIGMHLGLPWPQNSKGHVLGDVTDQSQGVPEDQVRGYQLGGVALPFHCDGSDLVGLMCLDNGREGGLSAVASSVRIHNQLVRERPDLARALYAHLPYDYRGEQPRDGKPFYSMPVFTEWDGRLFVRCIAPYIYASQRHPDAPRLTDLQREGLAAITELADDPTGHVLMDLQPGDMQFINNYHVLHGRTAYEDDRETGRVRHLKRLWLETTALPSRPAHFQSQRSHWNERRTASRLRVG